MKRTIKVQPSSLRAISTGRPVAVDRQNNILRGYVVAQAGPFKSEGRGQFDRESLQNIVALGNRAKNGLKSRFTHPTMSDDGLGKFLGRSRSFALGKAIATDGKTVDAVRADLHFDSSASDTPHGNLADYVMRLAESDPDAISSSLVLKSQYLDPKTGEVIESLGHEPEGGDPDNPFIWRPVELQASDIVDIGDAVDGLLSPAELCQALSVGLTPDLEKLLRFDNVARLSSQLLDGFFKGNDRQTVKARCQSWLNRYLNHRFGGLAQKPVAPQMDCPNCGMPMECSECDWQSGQSLPMENEPADMPMMRPQLDRRRAALERMRLACLAFVHNSETSDSEPDWGNIDKTSLPRMAFAEQGDVSQKSTWGFPHHWVQNAGGKDDNGVYTTGRLLLHVGGLNAAWAAANGARSGQRASQEVIAHLQAHRRAIGLE